VAIHLYDWSELPRQTIFDGNLSRAALRTDGAIVTFNWFEPLMPRPQPHSHPFDQLVMVMQGRLNLEIAGEIVEMPPGSAARIPPGVPHTAWPASDERVLNIDVFGTVREDYLFLTQHQKEVFAGVFVPAGPVSEGLSIWSAAGTGDPQDSSG
jgi:mannose-6-phosphate isomerase-like protein (cupin superfamily)